jgi:TonB family protein
MNKGRIAFFVGLLVVVILLARHNGSSRAREKVAVSTSPPAKFEATATPAAQKQPVEQAPVAVATPAAPTIEWQKPAERIAHAVALISTFDPSGKLLRTGSGCFVSEDGRLLTSADILKGAAHAVAKVSDGRILNVTGMLANVPALDIALLKADTQKGVRFVTPNESAKIDNNIPVAVVGSNLMRRKPAYFDRVVSARGGDAAGEWFGLSAPLPDDCTGAPIINERGEFIGIVSGQRPEGASDVIARTVGAAQSVIAHVDPHASPSWDVADNGDELVPSPAEGPSAPPPSTRVAKIPLVRSETSAMTKLIYSPKPKFPAQARGRASSGEGRYRVRFAANGQVQDVQVLESARNPDLDNAAVSTLRQWKAAPGQQWSATVPISFQP